MVLKSDAMFSSEIIVIISFNLLDSSTNLEVSFEWMVQSY